MQSRAQLPSKTGRLAQNQELIGQKLLHLQEAGVDVRRIATGQGDLEGLHPALLSCVVVMPCSQDGRQRPLCVHLPVSFTTALVAAVLSVTACLVFACLSSRAPHSWGRPGTLFPVRLLFFMMFRSRIAFSIVVFSSLLVALFSTSCSIRGQPRTFRCVCLQQQRCCYRTPRVAFQCRLPSVAVGRENMIQIFKPGRAWHESLHNP